MTEEDRMETDMAAAAALGIAEMGIEGTWGSAVCSTGGDRPSLGVSQWEGERADRLLAAIPGGEAYAGRPWSALTGEEREALSALLDSKAGRAAQWALLTEDALRYVRALEEIPALGRPGCTVYAAMWCPTSEAVVLRFLRRHEEDTDLSDLGALHALFRSAYADAAGVPEYRAGYEARADRTYAYTAGL